MALPGTLATIVGGVCLVLGISAIAHDLSQPLREQAQARLDDGWAESRAAAEERSPLGTVMLGDGELIGVGACLGIGAVTVATLSADDAVDWLASRGVSRRAIVHIGTSQGLTEREARDVLAVLGGQSLVVWSTIQVPDDRRRFTFEKETNRVVRALAREHDHVRLLDWNRLTSARPELLLDDGVRASARGCRAYARLVARLLEGWPPRGPGSLNL